MGEMRHRKFESFLWGWRSVSGQVMILTQYEVNAYLVYTSLSHPHVADTLGDQPSSHSELLCLVGRTNIPSERLLISDTRFPFPHSGVISHRSTLNGIVMGLFWADHMVAGGGPSERFPLGQREVLSESSHLPTVWTQRNGMYYGHDSNVGVCKSGL